MYYEVYLDILFLVNFLMDYILLLIVRTVLRERVPLPRICAGALLGALSSCVVTACNVPVLWLRFVLFYIVSPVAMLVVTMKPKCVRAVFRGVAALYIGGVILGGVFELFEQYIPVGGLFFAFAIASYYLSSGVLRLLMCFFRFGETHCEVVLLWKEARCRARAIVDTGNHLEDPFSGKSVSIVTAPMAERIFGGKLPDGLRYIPYATIGEDPGVIPVAAIDAIIVKGKDEKYVEKPLIGISSASSFAKECDVILNPDL